MTDELKGIGGCVSPNWSYIIAAVPGFDWLGAGYDSSRTAELDAVHYSARKLANAGKSGTYLVRGSLDAVTNSWPVWAKITQGSGDTDK